MELTAVTTEVQLTAMVTEVVEVNGRDGGDEAYSGERGGSGQRDGAGGADQ